MLDGDPIEAAEALIAAGKADEAVRDLKARLAAGRGGLLARLTLIKALLASGANSEALVEAREAVSLNPGVAVAVMALGEALLAVEALPTAIAELQRALRLDPDLSRARLLIAQAWLAAGEADKALENLHALEDPPADMIAAAQAIKTAQRSDPGYVRHAWRSRLVADSRFIVKCSKRREGDDHILGFICRGLRGAGFGESSDSGV